MCKSWQKWGKMAKVAKKSSYGWDPHLQRSKPRQMSGGASPARAACVVFACHPSGVFLASQRGKWACLEIWFGAEIIRSLFPKRFEKESNQSERHPLHITSIFCEFFFMKHAARFGIFREAFPKLFCANSFRNECFFPRIFYFLTYGLKWIPNI